MILFQRDTWSNRNIYSFAHVKTTKNRYHRYQNYLRMNYGIE